MKSAEDSKSEDRIEEHNRVVASTPTFWRSAPAPGGETVPPILYVHGVPTSSDDWLPFLERTGGVAVDLPGFGRSEKDRMFDYSIGGYNDYLQSLIAELGWDRFSLVVHDWGSLALVTAQELHDRIDRVVIVNAVPLLPGYRWHRAARVWRMPGVGEFAMGMMTKGLMRMFSKDSRANNEPWPEPMVDSVWKHFDHGTQRAILRLYRSAPPEVLELAGERFSLLRAPALVIWGERDPYIPANFAKAYADALPNAKLTQLPDAGHWPWLDQPKVIDTITRFLLASADAGSHTEE